MIRMDKHVVLLGDSVFDNGAYIQPGELDVARHAQRELPDGWRVTLLAVDGDRIADVEKQLSGIPSDATHLAISVGGNDALAQVGFLSESALSVADVLLRLADIAAIFRADYESLLKSVLGRGLPTMVCTIYESDMQDPTLHRIASTALMAFNDGILRTAAQAGLPVLDLRLICTEPKHYSHEIEPSSEGGQRIARGVAQVMTGHDFEKVLSCHYRGVEAD